MTLTREDVVRLLRGDTSPDLVRRFGEEYRRAKAEHDADPDAWLLEHAGHALDDAVREVSCYQPDEAYRALLALCIVATERVEREEMRRRGDAQAGG